MSNKKLPIVECTSIHLLLPIGMQSFPSELSLKVIDKVTTALRNFYKNSGLTYYKIGELCNTSEKHICNLINGKFGGKFTLDMALKIWTGLGHPPETLIADCNVEPLLAARIKRIQEGEHAELLTLLVNVLYNIAYIDDARELAKVEGYLEAIWDRIVKLKEQPPAEPGGKLSNSGEVKE